MAREKPKGRQVMIDNSDYIASGFKATVREIVRRACRFYRERASNHGRSVENRHAQMPVLRYMPSV